MCYQWLFTSHVQTKNTTSLKWLVVGIACLVGLACIIGITAAFTYITPEHGARTNSLTMDHIFNGTFYPERESVNWVPEGLSAVSLGDTQC